MLGILGITMVSILSGASLIKGFMACGLGMLLGAVGTAPGTGEERLMLGGNLYLIDGLPLAVVALAIFAVPEINDLLRRGQPVSNRPIMAQGRVKGALDVFRNRWLVLRSSLIGCLIGALPIGASSWIAYGYAVQTSKPRDRFGKGDIRGVIAPESANNAADGGALVPALIFGIPGSGSSAVFLGGLITIGIQPGPNMVQTNLDITYTIIWSLALANIFGAGICFLLSRQMARLTSIRFVYMAPYLLTVVLFGAFQATRSWGDLIALFAIGVFAIFLRRFGFARPAFLIGFVLQPIIETLLYQTIQIYTLTELLSRPLMWVMISVVLASVIFGIRNRPVVESEGQSLRLTTSELLPQFIFVFIVASISAYAIFEVWPLQFTGKVFPFAVGVLTLLFSGWGFLILLRGSTDHPMIFDSEVRWRNRESDYESSLYHYILWLAGLMAAIYLIGFMLAVVGFFIAFLRVKARANPLVILSMTVGVFIILTLISHFFVIRYPSGVLQGVLASAW